MSTATVTRRPRGFRATALAATLTAALLAGCGQDDSDTPRSAERGGGPRDSAPGPAAPHRGAEDAKGGPGAPALTTPVRALPADRALVYVGDLTVRVTDLEEAAGRAATVATAAGGVVAGDDRRSGSGRATATLVLRVPSEAFHRVVESLSDLGQELDRGLHTDDVTEAVVDLDARITSQQASVDRTRALLARAQQIADIVAIERELATREAELASLQAQKRALEDKVTLSTITVNLVTRGGDADDERGFLAGLASGWEAFTGSLNAVLTGLGAALPFLVALVLPVLAAWLLLRRRLRAGARPAAPPATDA